LIGVIADLDARPIARIDHPYPGPLPAAEAASLIRAQVAGLIERSSFPRDRLVGLGICLPGLIDPDSGRVIKAVNWGWEQIDLRELVGDLDGLAVHVLDVSVALALGEAYFGAGRGARNAICVNVGEGIGSGLFLNGAPYLGSDGLAGEIGHMTVDEDGPRCRCGNYGCLERLAAAPAVLERTLKGLKYGAVTTLRDRLGAALESVTLSMIVDAAQQGDEFSRAILSETGRFLGVGIANVVNLLNPEVVVLGGEVVQTAGDLLLEPLRLALHFRAFEAAARRVRLAHAGLGIEASAFGAATWAMIQAGFPPVHEVATLPA
jgi:predicted NBD/HSP70 family sugar kinase